MRLNFFYFFFSRIPRSRRRRRRRFFFIYLFPGRSFFPRLRARCNDERVYYYKHT